MNDINLIGRRFQLWGYKVSHGELLIRSPKTPGSINTAEQVTNVDIMFFGVDYINLPRSISELEIDKPTDDEISFVKEKLNEFDSNVNENNIYILKSKNHRHIIVAAQVKISENDMDISETEFTSDWKM